MEDIKKIQEFFSKPMGESQSEDKEEILKKSIILAQELLKRFDNDFEKGYVRMHIHDYNIRRNHLLDNLLLARQRLSDFKKLNEAESEDPVDTITMDVPLFIRMLEYSREDAQEDMDLHDVAEKAILLNKEKGILSMKDYNEIVGGVEDTSKSKIKELAEAVFNKLKK